MRFGPAEQVIEVSEIVEAIADVFENSDAIVAAAAAVGGVTGRVVHARVTIVVSNGVDVGENDVGTSSVVGVVKVVAVESHRDGMV